jgi:hypothetical protein
VVRIDLKTWKFALLIRNENSAALNPTLAAKTKARRGWGTQSLWARTIVAVALVAAFSALGCKKSAVNPFPASGAIAGWQKSGDTRVFAAKDLWQYIDGDAEQYLQAGVVTTSTADYKYQNQLEAVVDVHTMRDAAGARKILETGQTADARQIAVGDAGVQYAQSVAFRKGPYMVRIVAYQSSPDAPQALLALAHGVEAKL